MNNSSYVNADTSVAKPGDTAGTPDLKDPNITPGSILDLDADGRRDSKEMSLHALWHLQHGDTMANGHVTQPKQNCVLALPELLPSTNIPALPVAMPTPYKDPYTPAPYEDED